MLQACLVAFTAYPNQGHERAREKKLSIKTLRCIALSLYPPAPPCRGKKFSAGASEKESADGAYQVSISLLTSNEACGVT